MKRRAVVTGGCGFIGSHLIRNLLDSGKYEVTNLDCLTYAGNLATTADFAKHDDYKFERVDIRDSAAVKSAFSKVKPEIIFHLAAESHVDRSIDGPREFIETNVLGTFCLLNAALDLFNAMDSESREAFRFVNVSTDEVFGSLGDEGFFDESTPYDPRSPYSASKASADHLCRAWFHTFDLPVLVTNCSNNYGPYQYPEKLIPVIINKAMGNEPIPIYGDGKNIRDWLYVADHASAIRLVGEKGEIGQTYAIGTNCEKTNLEIVSAVCDIIDRRLGLSGSKSKSTLIEMVKDRPGHDRRYAINAQKITEELGWKPLLTFEDALSATVSWYLDNQSWCSEVTDGANHLQRLGTIK